MSLIIPFRSLFDYEIYFSGLFTHTMGLRKLLKEPQIEAMYALVRDRKSNKEIAANMGISVLRAVQCWTKKNVLPLGCVLYPYTLKPAGHKQNLMQRFLNIICWEPQDQTSMASWDLKQNNQCLLAGVAEHSERLFEEGFRLQEFLACA